MIVVAPASKLIELMDKEISLEDRLSCIESGKACVNGVRITGDPETSRTLILESDGFSQLDTEDHGRESLIRVRHRISLFGTRITV